MGFDPTQHRELLPPGYFYGGEFGIDFAYSSADLARIKSSVTDVSVTDECIFIINLFAVNALLSERQKQKKYSRSKIAKIERDAISLVRSLESASDVLPRAMKSRVNSQISDLKDMISVARTWSIDGGEDRGAAFNRTAHDLYRGAMAAWEALTARALPAGGGDADASHIRFIKAVVDPVLTSLGLRVASGDAVRKRIADMVSERDMYPDLVDPHEE